VLIVSWNVAGRRARLPEQAERLLALGPDIVCLQEIRPSTLPLWSKRLAQAGYGAIENGELSAGAERTRALAVLTASRDTLERVPVDGIPWPERVLAVRLGDGTEVVNVHSPTSPKLQLAKLRTHEAVHEHLAGNTDEAPRILCGDLNTPRKEHADGRVWTFARDRYGRLRDDRGERWDRAELSLIRGLGADGFRDAFRSLHGFTRTELSWEWARWGGGYRLDHMLVSTHFQIESCEYEHGWRRAGLSDHSAVLARLRLRG
jgi:exonuclease III